MSWEGLKNILLFSLIVISGLLTWSYWFYQPSYEIDTQTQHVQLKFMDNGNVEPDEVVQPIKILYYDGGSYYGTYSEEIVSEMMGVVKNVNLFNLQDRSESYGDEKDIRELVEKDGAIEVVFNDSVPLSFYKKFLKIEDSIVPDVYFDRIVVFTREDDGHSVYFISEDKNAVLAAALEKEDLERFGAAFADTELYAKYKKVAITNSRSVIVPANEQRVTGFSYLTKSVPSTNLKKALFSSPEIVKQEGDIYTDGVSLMKVNSKTGMIEYKNLAIGAKEEKNTDNHILQRNIDYINSHSGWDKRYRFAAMDEEEREIIYRLYISGLPVFSDIGISEFDVEWGTENVRMYERPYIYLGDKALTKSDAILPRAEDALTAFQESINKQYNPDKLADMTIGYEMMLVDKDIVTLKPNWYFLYDHSWIKIMDKGGIMDGLE